MEVLTVLVTKMTIRFLMILSSKRIYKRLIPVTAGENSYGRISTNIKT